jgi:hypothetical protein
MEQRPCVKCWTCGARSGVRPGEKCSCGGVFVVVKKLQTGEAPSEDQLREWSCGGGCEAIDGCWVEPDGICEHGQPSWLLRLGLI